MIAILCKFCGENIEVRAWNEHLSGEKHRKNLPSKVVVAGKFESGKIDEVHAYFAKFGKIKTKQVLSNTGEFITLIKYCYEDPMAYSIIVQKQHLFGGQELKINWCKMDDSEYCGLITKINDTLREKTQSFAQQIETVQEILQTNSKIATSSEKILNDLTTSLTTVYPDSKLHFFGSEALNLNMPDSDLNIYIDNVQLTTSIEQSSLRLLQTVISRSEKFENICLITREFPRIECKHVESQIKCLISIHKSVIRSTEMIKCYLNLDSKIRSLMFVIKFWARCHRLTESDGFSNHVLYLLVIFYLQQEPYKLPAIVNLLDVENGWRCSSNLAEFVNLENSSIFELVSGFFRFYETFDYVSYVVAPFCGLALEKTSFLEPYLLPTCYNEYVDQKKTLDVDCGLCVQDPFNHSSNLLSGIPLNCGGDFTSQCRKSLITGDCPYLTTMLRDSNNQHFTINKLEGFTDDEWTSSVTRVTSTILDTICGCQVKTVKVKGGHYLYTCNGNFEIFWKDRISVLKKLLPELSIGVSEICKEIDVTTNFIKAGTEQKENTKKCSLIIEAKFEKNPSRVQFCFKKLVNGDTHFEHYFRVKMVVFLKEIVTKKCLSPLSAAKVAQGKFVDLKVMVNALIQKDEERKNTFAEQISTLQTQLEDYSQNTETIRDGLALILLPWFPGSTVHLATAHLDILSSFVHVYVGGIQSQNSAISTIENIIRQSGKFDSTRIVSAHEIKCRHTKTLTLCHISIDKLAVGKAQLVEYYMNLHEKVHSLLLVVTYWAHCSDLVGSDGLSTYSLCLLVFFYLQQEPYVLPAVADLKNNLQENTHHEISTLESPTILELVNGFFKFYDTFDYLYFVVTPYCGYPVEKSRFCKPYNVPSCFSYYVKHKKDLSVDVTMCIQDPFDHCRNVVQGASAVCGGNFASKCRNSITYTSDESMLLYNILNQPEYRQLSIHKVDNCGVDEWVCSTDNVTSEVLTKIFAFNIVKDWKPKLHQISYNCVINGDVWKGRMNAMKTLIPKLPSGISEMKKEIAVSLQTLKKNKTQIFERSVVVDLHFKIDPHRVEIFIRGFEAPCRKMYIEQFLRVKLRKFVEEYLRDQTGNNILEEPLTFDSDSRDSSYNLPPNSDENLPSKAINLTEDEPNRATLKKDVETKEKHRLVKPKTANKENPICRSRSPKPKRERFRTNSKESSRSKSKSYSKTQDKEEVKAKTPENNQRRSTSDSEHSRCSSRSREHSKTHPRGQSRSRSRSRCRSYGENKDKENIRTKKPKWNRRRSTSSDSQRSRSPTRRRERSKKHPKQLRSRSRSRSHGISKDKENIEAKKNQRTSSSASQHSRSSSRSREYSKSRRTETSRSRSRSTPYGQNKDRENVRTKKPKWNRRRSTSSDSQHSRSPTRRRERSKRHPKRLRFRSRSRSYKSNTYKRSPRRRRRRSKSSSDEQSRSRSRSFRRNGDKENVKTEKPTSNQRRSSTKDTQSPSPNKREERKKSKRNQSRSRSDSEHSSSPCRTKERTKRWCRDAQKELLKQRKSFLEEVREKLKEVSQPVMSSVPFPYDHSVYQGALPPPPFFASHLPDLHAPQHAQYANLSVVTIVDPLPMVSNEMKIYCSEDMVTTSRTENEVEDQVLEPKDKIMLQCLKTLRAMMIQTPRRPRVLPSKKPIYKASGQSPLQNPQTQFKFTSPPQDSKVASFEETLLDILHAVDICSDPNDIPQLTKSVAEVWQSNGTIDKNTAAKILQISLLGAMQERRSKERVEVGTQCYVGTRSVEVQVGVDVFVHKMVRRDPRIYRYPMLLKAKEGNKPRNAYGIMDQVKRKAGYED